MPGKLATSVLSAAALATALGALAAAHGATARPEAPTGLWRGTSTCTDRIAAPSCKDEVVVYVFTAGATPDTVHWQADKVIDGQRQTMGEFELRFDEREACWKAQFDSPRTHVVWCVVVEVHASDRNRASIAGRASRAPDRRAPGAAGCMSTTRVRLCGSAM